MMPEDSRVRMEKVEIHAFAFGGRALGRMPDGKVCFVRGALPGETVLVRITSEKKRYSEGELSEILSVSPLRCKAACPNPCPGCSYMHISYEAELEWKQRQFESFLLRSGLADREVIAPPVGAEQRTTWRNKLKLSLEHAPDGSIRAGYRAEDNVSLIEVHDCSLAAKEILEAYQSGGWKKRVSRGDRAVTFRFTPADGVCFFTDTVRPAVPLLTETIAGFGEFRTPAESFFQINAGMSGRLAERVVALAERCEAKFLLELYCGCGCFSIAVAERRKEMFCHGVEIDPRSIACAKENAMLHGVAERCAFSAGDAGKSLGRLLRAASPEETLLLVDPPRTGMDRRAPERIRAGRVGWILYVSCAPDTLARDLALLRAGGYRVLESGLIDMFPSTAHFETVTLLKRGS